MLTRRINHKAAVRAAVWDACAGKCHHCGCELHPFRGFHLDHLVPLCEGGEDAIENLVGSCAHCNQTRTHRVCRPVPREVLAMIDANELLSVNGDELRRRRLALMWTTRELAGYAKTGHDAISDLEQGKRRPRRALLARIAAALECEIQDLLREPGRE